MKKSLKPSLGLPIIPAQIDTDTLVAAINDRLRRLQLMTSGGQQSSDILFGTHSARLKLDPTANASAAFFETDRNYVAYISDGKHWHYADGMMYGPIATRPAGFTANDEGFLFLSSTAPLTLYRWTAGAWLSVFNALSWVFRGIWSNAITYAAGDVVNYDGTLWISAAGGNVNVSPLLPPSDPPVWVMANWLHLASLATFSGSAWSATTTYVTDNVVAYLGELWTAIAGSTGSPPTLTGGFWAPFDTSGIVPTSNNKVGIGLNLRYEGHNWITGALPDNAAAAMLVDAVTGITSLYAVNEVPNTGSPFNPLPQLISPGTLESDIFLQADPRVVAGVSISIPYWVKYWPLIDNLPLLVNTPSDTLAAKRARFDLTNLVAAEYQVYLLPTHTDRVGANLVIAAVDPPHGGTGQSATPSTATIHSWALGKLLVGDSTADTTKLLAIGTAGQVLTVSGGTATWQSLPSGVSATITLAALTGGGTQGSLTIVNGIITAAVNPT